MKGKKKMWAGLKHFSPTIYLSADLLTWICIRSILFSGKNLSNKELDREDIVYRDMDKGKSAIWNRIACIDPNSRDGMIRFAQ